MADIQNNIKNINNIINEVTDTSTNVNRLSHRRKDLTEDSNVLINKLKNSNSILRKNFDKIYQNLNDSLMEITSNSEEFRKNIEHFTGIITNINNIKSTLDVLEGEIARLTTMVNEVKDDTDEIFSLALNASIVSSKYTHTSSVFDILADRLNEMSSFIDQNLTDIVKVVRPITDGINKLTYKNAMVLSEIEDGYESFIEFPNILDKQKESIDELLLRAYMSGTKIDDQSKMLSDIHDKVTQMHSDADESINGSGNVKQLSEELGDKITMVDYKFQQNEPYRDIVEYIRENSATIWHSAQRVNEKSKSQLDFSLKCVDFCDSIISESTELKSTTEVFNEQSAENNTTAKNVSLNLSTLTSKLDIIKTNILDSNSTIEQFNENYLQIDNIVTFLKNILKQMNVIGMYSRIESARDPEEFAGFITISDNIRSLQNHIHNNIPLIEENILKTHQLITNVNTYFNDISTVFKTIADSSVGIIKKLGEITVISSESERISQNILNENREIDNKLNQLRNFLIKLSEVVKKPIEGSAANIERGKNIENLCIEIGLIAKQDEAAIDMKKLHAPKPEKIKPVSVAAEKETREIDVS